MTTPVTAAVVPDTVVVPDEVVVPVEVLVPVEVVDVPAIGFPPQAASNINARGALNLNYMVNLLGFCLFCG